MPLKNREEYNAYMRKYQKERNKKLREYLEEVEAHKLKLRCWKAVWNEEIKKAKQGLTETKELVCPYCEGIKFRGTGTLNTLGMLRHMYDVHREEFTGYFYNLMDYLKRTYDEAQKFVEMTEARQEYIKGLKEGYATMEQVAMQYRQIAVQAIEQFKKYDTINTLQEIMLENLEAKLKGDFKGHSKPFKLRETGEAIGRPTYRKEEKK